MDYCDIHNEWKTRELKKMYKHGNYGTIFTLILWASIATFLCCFKICIVNIPRYFLTNFHSLTLTHTQEPVTTFSYFPSQNS